MLERQDAFRDAMAVAAADEERRSGKRHQLVLLVGKRCDGDTQSACLVRDISRFGLMARFTVPPVMGEPICIEVRGLPPIHGIVRWVKDGRAGVEFDEPQDVDQVFKLKRDDGMIARPPRFPVTAAAVLRLDDSRFAAEVVDISPGGAKLVADMPVTTGQTGQILLRDTGTALFGTVCWTRDDHFGFRFVAPMPLATLSQILGC